MALAWAMSTEVLATAEGDGESAISNRQMNGHNRTGAKRDVILPPTGSKLFEGDLRKRADGGRKLRGPAPAGIESEGASRPWSKLTPQRGRRQEQEHGQSACRPALERDGREQSGDPIGRRTGTRAPERRPCPRGAAPADRPASAGRRSRSRRPSRPFKAGRADPAAADTGRKRHGPWHVEQQHATAAGGDAVPCPRPVRGGASFAKRSPRE